MEQYGRIVGILNPLMFYPSVQELKQKLQIEDILPDRVMVNCHPSELKNSFRVGGFCGAAQPLQRLVSYITGSYPVSLSGEANPAGEANIAGTVQSPEELSNIRLDYDGFEVRINFTGGQPGWNMELEGHDITVRTDHTGMLAFDEGVEPRIAPDPGVMGKAIADNLRDYMEAVRNRSEPLVNTIDGLASIVLNNAVRESVETGAIVYL
jgi:hypothetical protein